MSHRSASARDRSRAAARLKALQRARSKKAHGAGKEPQGGRGGGPGVEGGVGGKGGKGGEDEVLVAGAASKGSSH